MLWGCSLHEKKLREIRRIVVADRARHRKLSCFPRIQFMITYGSISAQNLQIVYDNNTLFKSHIFLLKTFLQVASKNSDSTTKFPFTKTISAHYDVSRQPPILFSLYTPKATIKDSQNIRLTKASRRRLFTTPGGCRPATTEV